MAIWNYRYYLIPSNSIKSKLINTDILIEYKKNSFHDFNETKEFENYFEQHHEILNFIKNESIKSLKPMKSWDDDACMFCDEYGNVITIWSDDIMCELDLRFNYIEFVKKTINWAIKYECVIVIVETGKVINPEINNFLDIINNSDVNNILKDPIKFMRS